MIKETVLRRILYVATGLAILGSASDYSDYPEMRINSISMYICCGLDFMAGILSLTARYFLHLTD
jgi:predicted membrane channel-forming protein YqfA (hemolysin III family)